MALPPDMKLITNRTAKLPGDWKNQLPSLRRNKYNARKVTVDGYVFDSGAEAKRYGELKLLERAGQIVELKVHPSFALQDPFRKEDGSWVRPIVYEADFSYRANATSRMVVEDYKGWETPVWKQKQKMFWKRYPDITLKVTGKRKPRQGRTSG